MTVVETSRGCMLRRVFRVGSEELLQVGKVLLVFSFHDEYELLDDSPILNQIPLRRILVRIANLTGQRHKTHLQVAV